MNEQARTIPENIHEVTSTTDPYIFISKFRESADYKLSFNNFFLGKQLAADVTLEEMHESFEASELAGVTMVNFSEQRLQLVYYPEFYPTSTIEVLTAYIDTVQKMNQRSEFSPDELQEIDRKRSIQHSKVARNFAVEGIAPNINFGKILARLILIDLKLDTFESARVSGKSRIH